MKLGVVKWDPTTTYSKGDIVTFQGSTYIARESNTSILPLSELAAQELVRIIFPGVKDPSNHISNTTWLLI